MWEREGERGNEEGWKFERGLTEAPHQQPQVSVGEKAKIQIRKINNSVLDGEGKKHIFWNTAVTRPEELVQFKVVIALLIPLLISSSI